MLFCVTSILERAADEVTDRLVEIGFKRVNYEEGILEEIMEDRKWDRNIVINIPCPSNWAEFRKRPFSFLVSVCPNMREGELISSERYNKYTEGIIKIDTFIDRMSKIEIREDEIEILKNYPIRPNWEIYFMRIAEIASTRSNCMKRRVGAVIVKNRRIIAVGYNGTPSGSVNCSEGGCNRCNSNIRRGVELANCFCIHAEESAFLERSSSELEGSSLYTTVFPCRLCSRKIVQLRIVRVFYLYEYTEDREIEGLFSKNKIEVKRVEDYH